ncbi:13080_t:CDS:1, partial [Racocetra fulgida]
SDNISESNDKVLDKNSNHNLAFTSETDIESNFEVNNSKNSMADSKSMILFEDRDFNSPIKKNEARETHNESLDIEQNIDNLSVFDKILGCFQCKC